ncbi:hypothetical protein ACQ4PT_004689 [Festuca glaucescens]
MTMAVSSPSKKGGLRGPRPQALKVTSLPPPSARPSTKKSNATSGGAGTTPVIVYEHTPKIVHARPDEFMTVVQRLTGKPPASSPAPPLLSYDVHVAPVEEGAGGGDHLLLTLGQHRAPPMAAGQLMSPGGFFFSPNTMQSIQELSPMF